MFQTISEYWDLIREFTNPVKIMFSATGTAIVTFLVSVVLIILLRKLVLIKRQYIILKILGISYFALIPIISLFFGFKWGLVDGIHDDLKDHVCTYTKSLDKAYNQQVQSGIGAIFSGGGTSHPIKISSNDIVDTIASVLYQNYESLLQQKFIKDKSIEGNVAGIFLKLFKEKGISFAVKKGITTLVEKRIGIDESVTNEVMETKINDLLKTGVLTKMIEVQLDNFFYSIKKGIILLFCMILLIPITEIGIAFWLNKKQNTPVEPLHNVPEAPTES